MDEALNQAQNQVCRAVLQLSRRSHTQHLAQHQADVERADVNQLAFEYVLPSAQGAASHSAGLVAMSEASFDQLASPLQQSLAILAAHPLTVLINRPLLPLFAFPVPLAGLLLFRNVYANFEFLYLFNHTPL